MQKTILVTGSTDGIGLETAKALSSQGHHVLIHGRNPEKLEQAKKILSNLTKQENIESYTADLSRMSDVATLAEAIIAKHDKLDVLINNAGIYKTPKSITQDGMDVRFVVNTIAPYLLTKKLLPLLNLNARVINLSSAAQAPVDLDALAGRKKLTDDFDAYAQSKLALTMWSHRMALSLKAKGKGPVIIAVNPGSLLATKMVTEGFGVAGHDIGIGADILTRLALADEFANTTGQYFDNDAGSFVSPHKNALDADKCEAVINTIETILTSSIPS